MNDPNEVVSGLPDRISFCKMSASGNDFIVLDNREGVLSEAAPELARRICARRYSVGADGMILVENSNKASVRLRFFNPDGGEFNTCGNGGRCAARFAHLSVMTGKRLTLETNIGVIDAEILGGTSVKLQFLGPTEIRLHIPILVDDKQLVGHFVQLGDPHFVLYAKDIRAHPIVHLARKIRYNERFPEGTNVHFIEPLSRERFRIRSYERGIEDETLACGSGCISAALSTHASKQSDPPVTFEPQSGIPLTVHFPQHGDYGNDLYLEGDARLVYSGQLTKEALLGFPFET